MRRAEQQLTRVKVDIIRCHSHFLPKTHWIFSPSSSPSFSSPPPPPHVSSLLFQPKATVEKQKKKRFPCVMRLSGGALVNAVETDCRSDVSHHPLFVFYFFLFSTFVFSSSSSTVQERCSGQSVWGLMLLSCFRKNKKNKP